MTRFWWISFPFLFDDIRSMEFSRYVSSNDQPTAEGSSRYIPEKWEFMDVWWKKEVLAYCQLFPEFKSHASIS